MNALDYERAYMNRQAHLGAVRTGCDITDRIASEHRNFPLMQPFQAGSIEPRQTFAARVPGAFDGAPLMASGANQQDIAFSDLQVTELFGCFEILGINRVAQFEPFDLLRPRDIEQDATAHHTIARYVDGTAAGAKTADLALAEAIVHLAFPKHVAERIKMGKCHPMRRDCEVIERSIAG